MSLHHKTPTSEVLRPQKQARGARPLTGHSSPWHLDTDWQRHPGDTGMGSSPESLSFEL